MRAGMDLLGNEVVEEDTRKSIGSVTDVLFDDGCRHVVALVTERRRLLPRRRVIAFDQIRAFCPEVVVAQPIPFSPHPVAVPTEPSSGSLEGRPVVSAAGDYLGAVSDVFFDEHTGRVTAFELTFRGPRHMCRRRTLLPADLRVIIGDGIVLGPGQRAAAARGAATLSPSRGSRER